MSKCVVIFGGCGFIGSDFAKLLETKKYYSKIYLFDLVSPDLINQTYRAKLLKSLKISNYIKGDVRKNLDWFKPKETVDLILNLAAIHREPGHQPNEYFETNIIGAKNIFKWADLVGCKSILFTSSISVYGSDGEYKTENSVPYPNSAYGSSKLVAEKMHETWKASNKHNKLIILRPGVIYGPGESGNVTRLVKAINHNYFCYFSNKNIFKSGIYIKELSLIMEWLLFKKPAMDTFIYNISFKPIPRLDDFVTQIKTNLSKNKFTINLPYFLIFTFTYFINLVLNFLKIKHPFDLVRIRKLISHNQVFPKNLIDQKYNYKFDLSDSMKDWKKECIDDWK